MGSRKSGVDPSPNGGGGGGGRRLCVILVKWAFTQTWALTHADTVIQYAIVFRSVQ